MKKRTEAVLRNPSRLTVRGDVDVRPLLDLFASLMPLCIDHRPALPGHEGELFFVTTEADEGHDGAPLTLSVVRPIDSDAVDRTSLVGFSRDPETPFPFAGRSIATASRCGSSTLAPTAHERILAATAGGPVWSVATQGRARHFRTALPLPVVGDKTSFFDFFNEVRFVDALPIVHFLRLVTGETRYRPPAVRASFVIDDPNLHRPRYGHVRYRTVVSHAERNHYHVCFATIPLDTWYTHRATAELFKAWPNRVSLLVHGNNHAKAELATQATDEDRRALLRQSMRRMQRFTTATGLRVSSVMVPPHGACDHEMLGHLPRCGFEAACISSGSLRAHNPDRSWTRCLGFGPSEIVAGCPVLPRWSLGGSVEAKALLAAYLGQAIVLMGHHHDLADDMQAIDRAAAIINGLGDVVWGDMTTLSRLNYVARRVEGTLTVRPYGSLLRLPPDCGSELLIEPVARTGEPWRHAPTRTPATPAVEAPGATPDGSPLWRGYEAGSPRDESTTIPALSPRLVLRRLMTEARDRLAPCGRRLAWPKRIKA